MQPRVFCPAIVALRHGSRPVGLLRCEERLHSGQWQVRSGAQGGDGRHPGLLCGQVQLSAKVCRENNAIAQLEAGRDIATTSSGRRSY